MTLQTEFIALNQNLIQIDNLVIIDWGRIHKREGCYYQINPKKESLKPLHNWRFDDKEDALLAASMWLNTPESMKDVNCFAAFFKAVLRIIGKTESSWYL